MTAKEYLKRIKQLEYSITQRKLEISRLEQDRILLSGINYSGVRVQSSSDGQGFTKISDKLIDMQRETTELIHDMSEERHKIINQIQNIGDDKYSKILFDKYVIGKTLQNIADDIGYEPSYLRTLHIKALDAFYTKFLKE